MAKNNYPDIKYFNTPKGEAKYIFINEPQTLFNKEGVYSVDLLLDAQAPATISLQKELDGILERSKELALEKINNISEVTKINGIPKKPVEAIELLKEALMERIPYQLDYDKEGNETGMILFKFKMNRMVTRKKKPFEQKPRAFDSQNKPIDLEQVQVGGGSVIKIRFKTQPYYMPSATTYGVSMFLDAVQILELKSFSGGSGFEAEEGGFEASENYLNNNDNNNSEDFGGLKNDNKENEDEILF